jgi:hypothetical protein
MILINKEGKCQIPVDEEEETEDVLMFVSFTIKLFYYKY